MKSLAFRTVIAAVVVGLAAAIAQAHTAVKSTVPKSGSVLQQSPPVIEINPPNHRRAKFGCPSSKSISAVRCG